MHVRLSRGISVLDKELATLLVGTGVWYDIDSNRVWYMGCVCMLEEFLIIQRCWFGMESNIWWFRIIKRFCIFQQGLGRHRLQQRVDHRLVTFEEFLIYHPIYIVHNGCRSTRGCFLFKGFTTLKNLMCQFFLSLFYICLCVCFNLMVQYSLVIYLEARLCKV